MLSSTSGIPAALLILGNRAPPEEAPQREHPSLEQKEPVQDSVSAYLVLTVHFPSCEGVVLEHLVGVVKYLQLSESDHLVIVGVTEYTLPELVHLAVVPL